jgi:hypothetical protein
MAYIMERREYVRTQQGVEMRARDRARLFDCSYVDMRFDVMRARWRCTHQGI